MHVPPEKVKHLYGVGCRPHPPNRVLDTRGIYHEQCFIERVIVVVCFTQIVGDDKSGHGRPPYRPRGYAKTKYRTKYPNKQVVSRWRSSSVSGVNAVSMGSFSLAFCNMGKHAGQTGHSHIILTMGARSDPKNIDARKSSKRGDILREKEKRPGACARPVNLQMVAGVRFELTTFGL